MFFYNWQDVWLATSFKLPGSFGVKHEFLRFILSGRMYRNNYITRPFKRSEDGAQTFIDRTYFLGSIGFANWNYYVDHSVFYLGQAEYFSRGLNGALILGFDYDEELQNVFTRAYKWSMENILIKQVTTTSALHMAASPKRFLPADSNSHQSEFLYTTN